MATKPKRYNPQTKFTDSTTNFSGGINQALSASRLRENEFLELINLDIDKVGQAVKRYGLKQFAINGVPMDTIIKQELQRLTTVDNPQITPSDIKQMEVSDAFIFFDGIRNVLNFVTNIGLVTIVFNEAFTDIEYYEKYENGNLIDKQRLVLFYKNINHYVKFVSYNSQFLVYSSRPRLMVSDGARKPVARPEATYGDRANQEITIDTDEPITAYIWNPTNKNQVAFRDLKILGWIQQYNFNADLKTYSNFEIKEVKDVRVKTKVPIQAIVNDFKSLSFINSHPPFNVDNKNYGLAIDTNQYFVEPNGSFEYLRLNEKGQKHIFRFKSAFCETYDIVFDELSTLGDDEFLNFPIVYANGYFYFGGCTRSKMYFWRSSLIGLRNHNRPETFKVINSLNNIQFGHGMKKGTAAGKYINKNNVFNLNDGGEVVYSCITAGGSSTTVGWFENNDLNIRTSFDLIKQYKTDGCYGKVIKYEDWRGTRYCYALPVYHTLKTFTMSGLAVSEQIRTVIATDILYDVEKNTHNFAVSNFNVVNSSNWVVNEMKKFSGYGWDAVESSKEFYTFYDDNYLTQYCEDGTDIFNFKNDTANWVDIKRQTVRCFTKANSVLASQSDKPNKLWTEIRPLCYFGKYGIDTKKIKQVQGDKPWQYFSKDFFVFFSQHQKWFLKDKTDYVESVGVGYGEHLEFPFVYKRAVEQYLVSFSTKDREDNTIIFHNIGEVTGEYHEPVYKEVSVLDYYGSFSYHHDRPVEQLSYDEIGQYFQINQLASRDDLTFSHNDVPKVDKNNLTSYKDKLNYIGNFIFKKINEINGRFGKCIWYGWSKECVINKVVATDMNRLVTNMRNMEKTILNNPKLKLDTNFWVQYITDDLKQRIQQGQITGLSVDEVGDYYHNWIKEIGQYIDIRLITTNNPFSESYGNKLFALDLSDFEFIYEEPKYLLLTKIWDENEVSEFLKKLPTLEYLSMNCLVENKDMSEFPTSTGVIEEFIETTKDVNNAASLKKVFRAVFYGANGYRQGLRIDVKLADEWWTLCSAIKFQDTAKIISMKELIVDIYFSASGASGLVKRSDNPIVFKPIREYIPTASDIKVSSYNLMNLDDRHLADANRKSDISSHTANSRWLVRATDINSSNATAPDVDDSNFFANAILPINRLTLNPLYPINYQLHAYIPKIKPNLAYKWISMSVEAYNEMFFNDKYDWVEWFKKDGQLIRNDEFDSENKKLKKFLIREGDIVPYGDREWIVGWAIIEVKDGVNNDLGNLKKDENVISSAPILATYNFIPNDVYKEDILQRSFHQFLHTNKATTFAGRIVFYGNSNKLFFSDINNPTYFPLFNAIELPVQEVIRSCVEFGYYLIISTENFKFILRGRSFDNNSDNPFTLDNISADTGSISVDADKPNGNYLFFLDKTGIKALVNAYGTAEKEYKFKPVDELINPLLPDLVGKQGAIATTHDNRYYIHFPNTKQMFVYYNTLQTWTQYESELMNFSKLYSDNGILYGIAKKTMDLYWFDKDTYVDGYTGLDGAWDEKQYGTIWADAIGSMDGTYQKGIPIQTSLITRPIGGLDEDSIKAFYDIVINVRTNAPMNNLDLRIKLDDAPVIDTWSMSDGITNQHGMLFTHFLSTSKQQIDYYTRLFPQAVLNQTAVANYSRLGYTDLNTHKVKGLGRKGRELIIGIRNKTPASYAIESINVDYKFRSSK